MEAADRIELSNKAFAELCLTTWLRRHYNNLDFRFAIFGRGKNLKLNYKEQKFIR